MESVRYLERFFSKSEYIENTEVLPIVCSGELYHMKNEANCFSGRPCCFPFYRYHKKKPYIDVYIWDTMHFCTYQRFIIQEGYTLKPDEEDAFLKYLNQDIQISESLLERTIYFIGEDFPQIHLKRYKDLRHILLHLYFTLHRSGARETLYMANLEYLTAGLENIEGYNLIGTSPQQILGVQMGMLRAMNSEFGYKVLSSEDNRELASTIYDKYHNYITGRMLNKCQWEYLTDQYKAHASVDFETMDYLNSLKDTDLYYYFRKYTKYKDLLDGFFPDLPSFPEIDDWELKSWTCDMIEECFHQGLMLDDYLQTNIFRIKKKYAYETDEYFIVIPKTIRELIKEAVNLQVFLYASEEETSFYDEGEDIVFVRNKKEPFKPLIIIVIREERISEVYCEYNCAPDEHQQSFIETFAIDKGLSVIYDGLDRS